MKNLLTNPEYAVSRRGFLKMAAGAAAGAALLQLPFAAQTVSAAAGKREIRPVALKNLPMKAEEAAEKSPLIHKSYQAILDSAGKIKDSGLRKAVLNLIQDPTPTFMQEYTSQAAVRRTYDRLAALKLVDPSKLSVDELFPPTNKKLQGFLTAPGSGYGSHHPYPGGLCTHVSANLRITEYLCDTYKEVFYYDVDRDVAVAGQCLHDIEKPFVFQWQENGESRKEYTIGGQGAHHVLSIAESLYRGLPAEEIVAQACAHAAPTSPAEEAQVVGWLKAAAIICGKDPVRCGLLRADGEGLPAPHKQEGYIVHLGDHDWVLSVPASQKTIKNLADIAKEDYGMGETEMKDGHFQAFRNYIGAEVSFMYLNFLSAEPDGKELVRAEARKIVLR